MKNEDYGIRDEMISLIWIREPNVNTSIVKLPPADFRVCMLCQDALLDSVYLLHDIHRGRGLRIPAPSNRLGTHHWQRSINA